MGFGSDFDGVGYTLPTDLKGPEGFPMVIFHLLKRGYTEEEIETLETILFCIFFFGR